jgi:hypothetical protein
VLKIGIWIDGSPRRLSSGEENAQEMTWGHDSSGSAGIQKKEDEVYNGK